MKLSEILHKDAVFIKKEEIGKKDALDFLIAKIARLTNHDIETISKAVFERENKISTGIGFGIAVPHGRIKGWGTTTLAVLSVHQPIDYDALDGEPVYMVFMFISDADNPFEHVNVLAKLSYVVSEENNMERLKKAMNPDEYILAVKNMEKILK